MNKKTVLIAFVVFIMFDVLIAAWIFSSFHTTNPTSLQNQSQVTTHTIQYSHDVSVVSDIPNHPLTKYDKAALLHALSIIHYFDPNTVLSISPDGHKQQVTVKTLIIHLSNNIQSTITTTNIGGQQVIYSNYTPYVANYNAENYTQTITFYLPPSIIQQKNTSEIGKTFWKQAYSIFWILAHLDPVTNTYRSDTISLSQFHQSMDKIHPFTFQSI